MNNLQLIVKNDTRAAMHMAVELCEQGDFDSVSEIVRCKDCEYYQRPSTVTGWNDACYVDDAANRRLWRHVIPEGYCAWGELRGDME